MTTVDQSVPKIDSDDFSLGDLFKDFYTVPDFQREYVWEPEHVEKLLTDVLDEFYDEENRLTERSEYFIGSIVVCRDKAGTYQLIDGQQRMTTIYLLVCVVRDLLQELGEAPKIALQSVVKSVSMDPTTMEDVARHRLELQYEDSHGVLATIADACTPISQIPESSASVRHILEAYKTILEFLVINFDNDVDRIRQFLATFLHRVKLIRIETPNLAHALKVFETINDRGVGLNAMDLLKNLLFMKTTPGQYPKLKERWKELIDVLDAAKEKPLRFLRYYIMSHHGIDYHKGLREDEIYDWFVKNGEACGINADPLGFVDRLVTCARAYRNFLEGKDATGTIIPYLQNISLLAGGAVRQHLILLLAAQKLQTELFTELCRNVENLFFCYLITREPTKNFERSFARWSGDLREVTSMEALQEFVGKYFLSDMTSRSAAVDFAMAELSQSRIQQYRMRYILAKLTQYIDQRAWDNRAYATLEQYMESSVHVEHILPQTPASGVREGFDKPEEYEVYVERLGNLALLEKTINSSVSNGTYESKKPGYLESTFLLTKSIVTRPQVGVDTQLNRAVRDLLQFDTWRSVDIEERQKMLGEIARQVWMADVKDRPVESTEEETPT